MRLRTVAFYLPQFHPTSENDEWWGPGFTEWDNVVRGRPRFPGHHQPHLPERLGFYDLRLPETRMAQAELASKHGIDAFCYYHYWFHGRRVLDLPFAEVLSSGTPDQPFCLCWANESWTRSWDGRSGHVLLEQRYSQADDRQHLEALLPALTDPRYLRFEDRPVMLIYRSSQLPDPLRTTQVWREVAAAAGLELYLLRVESFLDETGDPRPLGFDAAVDFQPDWSSLPESVLRKAVSRVAPRAPRVNDRVLSYRRTIDRMLRRPAPNYPRWPCVFPSWDNTARRRVGATVFHGSTPDLYEAWVRAEVERLAAAVGDGEALLFVNAWNEWGEGAHLEPDRRHGSAYLDAHHRAVSAPRAP